MGEPTKLSARHLVNIGVFTAIYFVIMFGGGMLGIISPAMILVGALIASLIDGAVIALFLARTPVMGAMTILGTIVGLLMLLTGHYWATIVLACGLGLVADLIVRSGQYRSRGRAVLAYAVFQMWYLGPVLPIFFGSQAYFDEISESMGAAYADAARGVLTPWVVVVFMIVLFAVSCLSGWIGTKLLDKHFARAGVVS
ncbi:MptD family putative ECF transporter S component [Brooklawnia cerclae]|uniref:Energy-coupling factor transport system substrate-specific component n=1 Tax=Brooklawnia cerclae TaxID=349934 RepID=A0ABX0SLD8_9ACTN|nr:MptD family putative ECF transporter S component [Brooklawnia cerclae]NIH58754.1 energy-coupling factor transport system substrate-specific component [Brooklawnia cerclae]